MSSSGNFSVETLDKVVARLLKSCDCNLMDSPASALFSGPDPVEVVSALKAILAVLLPGRRNHNFKKMEELEGFFKEELTRASQLLTTELVKAIPFRWLSASAAKTTKPAEGVEKLAIEIVNSFFDKLPLIREVIVQDIEAAYAGDPAALSYAEVRLAYPSLPAIAVHRIAHEFYLMQVPIIPRIMSEWVHGKTGIDIHPGAQIGSRFFIDHGTGVVIGETSKIGKNVKIYQGVTLGSKSFPLDENGNPIKQIQRHPTVEDDVVIYANATVLGGDTVIGRGSIIGGNVFLTHSTSPGSVVVESRINKL